MTRRMKRIKAADLFCGAGGTSTGLSKAAFELGLELDLLAINHWSVAIDTHSINHPYAEHLCESLDTVDPRKIIPGGRLKILIASPECTHHSNARGGKPMSDQSRASAWHVVRWAEAIYIENILIENVREFRDWGPIGANGRPLKRRKGETYRAFIAALKSLGYTVEDRILNAANYGDPTTRERLFILARRGNKKIVWPEPTHSAKGETTLFGKVPRWRPARDIIDWQLKGESIFARKKPLSPNTMKRIMAGLKKFGGKAFVIGQQSAAAPRDVEQPIPTVAGAGAISFVEPFLMNMEHSTDASGHDRRVHSVEKPIGTVTAQARHALIEPYIVMMNGTAEDQMKHSNRSVNEPLPTVVGANHLYLAEPYLVEYHGGEGSERRTRSVEEPIPTLDTSNRFGLVEPFLVGVGGPQGASKPRSVDEPMNTVLAENHTALVEPRLVAEITCNCGHTFTGELSEACPACGRRTDGTVTYKPVEPFIIPTNHGDDQRAHSVDEPMRTITSVDAWALIEPYLVKYYGTQQGAHSVDEPLDTIASRDKYGIVIPELNGLRLDIRFRMLQPHELARAMSFPADYQFTGNREQKVKQIGNAVPVNLAKALCRALLEN